ncbi:MAG: peptidylprolyl isomerase [Labilithrix sp.]
MSRFAVTGLLLIVACGSPPGGGAVSVDNTSTAGAVAKASEPRTTDPTGARPPSNLGEPKGSVGSGQAPSKFGNLGMTGAGHASDPPASSSMKVAPAKISARHVLIQWMGADHAKDSVVRSKEQAFNVAKEVLRRARAKEDFARLAVEYSDEPNAGQRGGSLGRFGHGQMVPEFEAAAFKLDVGEISDVVESPFGFHVIQRTE